MRSSSYHFSLAWHEPHTLLHDLQLLIEVAGNAPAAIHNTIGTHTNTRAYEEELTTNSNCTRWKIMKISGFDLPHSLRLIEYCVGFRYFPIPFLHLFLALLYNSCSKVLVYHMYPLSFCRAWQLYGHCGCCCWPTCDGAYTCV